MIIIEQRTSIDARFREFHKEQPEVWDEFRRICLNLIGEGRTHYSAKAVWEIIRNHRKLNVDGQFEGFKLCNDFTSRYARLFVETYPQHAGFFTLRRTRQ